MRSRRHPRVFLLLAALACPVWSWAGDVTIDHAWMRATAPGQKVAGAFMEITADRDMELVAGATPRADHVELHFMRMDDGVMEMRELENISDRKDSSQIKIRARAKLVLCRDSLTLPSAATSYTSKSRACPAKDI